MPRTNWEPRALTALPVSLVLTTHMLLIAALAYLIYRTIALQGFVEIASRGEPSLLKAIGRGWSVVWGSLPPFILQFFTLMRNWVADEAGFREPFAELGRSEYCEEQEKKKNGSSEALDGDDEEKYNDDSGTSLFPEESRPKPNAHLTVLLDYRSYSFPVRWFYALRNGHLHLALAFLLSFIFLVLATPGSVALIYDSEVVLTTSVPLNESVLRVDGFPYLVGDWAPIVLAAMSEDLHGAPRYAWTNATHAFHPFVPDSATVLGHPPANVSFPSVRNTTNWVYEEKPVTARSKAYTVRVDCTAYVDNFGYRGKNTIEPSIEIDEQVVTVRFTDRGCNMTRQIARPTSNRPRILEVTQEPKCDDSPEWPTRLVVLTAEWEVPPAAQNNKTATSGNLSWPGAFSVTSCIPIYEVTPGLVTVSWPWSELYDYVTPAMAYPYLLASTIRPTIHDFVPLGPLSVDPWEYQAHFHLGITTAGYDPTSGPVANSLFGRLLVERMQIRALGPYAPKYLYNFTGTVHDPGSLRARALPDSVHPVDIHATLVPETIQDCLATAYRIALSAYGFESKPFDQPASQSPSSSKQQEEDQELTSQPASLTTTQRRLFLRVWLASTLLGLLLLSAISTAWLVQRRHAHPTPLTEKPEGLLAYACLLHPAAFFNNDGSTATPGINNNNNTCENCRNNTSTNAINPQPNPQPNPLSTMIHESLHLAAIITTTTPSSSSSSPSLLPSQSRIPQGPSKPFILTPTKDTPVPFQPSSQPTKIARQLWTVDDEAHFYLGTMPTYLSNDDDDGGYGTQEGTATTPRKGMATATRPRVLMAKGLRRRVVVVGPAP